MSELLQPAPEFDISWSQPDGKLDISSPKYPGYRVSATNMGIDIQSPLGIVTYRSIQRYKEFQAIPLKYSDFPSERYKHWQVLDAGPGLAELIPEVALTFDLPPIAIDPINYQLLIAFLERVLKAGDEHNMSTPYANELIRRAKIITDPGRVRLYNMKFMDAINRYPELEHCADIVVDFKGANYYDLSPQIWTIETGYLRKPVPSKPLPYPSERRRHWWHWG